MIQYYIKAAIDILTYALKPKYEAIIDNDMETAYDLSYGEHPQQVYDFYKGTSNKLLLFLHGGAWYATHRQRDYYRPFIEAFHTEHPDINVVNMDYRLLVEDDLTTNVFPNQIDDVQKVMEIFEDYDITIAGNSAGGHLALWYYLNELTPKASNVIPITSAYDGSVVEQSTQYYTKPTGIYFENGIPVWIQNQFVDSSVNMGGATLFEYVSPAYYANPNLDDILAVFCTRDAEVPINQKSLMQLDYPNIKYIEYDTWHSGWMGTSFASDLRSEMYNFMLKERTYQSQHSAGRYLVQQLPEESGNNRYGHSNTPFELDAKGSIDGVEFESFKGEVLKGLISDYALKKISYNFSSFDIAFSIITPETENGYTFMIIKNNTQRYLLTHKGFSTSKYTIPKGATNQDVEFLILRISDTEVLFFANTPEDWKYKIYYHVPTDPIILDSSNRLFTDIPSLYIFPIAAPTMEYVFRVQGEDGDGNLTEWSTEHTDGTDAFFVPLFDNESTNQFMPELEKIDLTSSLFSVIFYPTFNQGLGMIGVQYNNDQEILRSTDLDSVYTNTSDEVKPNVDAVLEMHRFNNDSEQYPNLLYQLGTQDLEVRAQLEWDAINGVEIPEVEIEFEPETQAILDRADLEGFVKPNIQVIMAMDELIKGLKLEGLWDGIYRHWMFAYNDSNLSNFTRIDWANPSGTLTTIVDGMSYEEKGFKNEPTESSSQWGSINTNIKLNQISQLSSDNFGWGGITFYNGDEGSGSHLLFGTATGWQNIFPVNDVDRDNIHVGSGVVLNESVNANGVGLKTGYRLDSNTVRIHIVEREYIRNQNYTTTGRNYNLFIARANSQSFIAGISNAFICKTFSSVENQKLRDLYNTYLTSIGLTPYA